MFYLVYFLINIVFFYLIEVTNFLLLLFQTLMTNWTRTYWTDNLEEVQINKSLAAETKFE